MSDNLLEVRDLHISFKTYAGKVQAVRGVNFEVKQGETLAIVGESGSGKSVTCNAVMRLIPQPPGLYEQGQIIFNDQSLLDLSEHEMANIRGNEIAMIFQDPMTSLNPTTTIGRQITEVYKIHKKEVSASQAKEKAIDLLRLVGIPNPEKRFNEYPHEFSGGMRQRVVIAIALAANPKLLIADEPTTALDVTIQAQILELMKKIQEETQSAIIFITHDLGVVANVADKVAVMYAGQVVEYGSVNEIFYNPKHPYTWGLLGSMPDLESDNAEDLYTIPGAPPNLIDPPKGDAFAPRNRFALAIDYEKEPPVFKINDHHFVKSWLAHEIAPDIAMPQVIQDRIDRYLSQAQEEVQDVGY
ncbi:ABC transporter ATP-binding protein [Facklamia sp. DSM 111018]|uniref:ABC transporter ATP-binding protein n=2 Tax=Facklamia lactis TaxID=2749967 RepID=A0ABS0LR36_9LACT|nr:ABC transporter ATP-binding protein [Facklamia lactis]MBG9986417.1 ABC transporter ATP-binding protein [Facklamia lactis]